MADEAATANGSLLGTGAATEQVSRDTTAETPKPAEQIVNEPAKTPEEQAAADKAVADAKAAEEAKAKEGKDKATEGAPEKYEDFKFAEGLAPDPEAIAKFQTVAKDLNLNQAQAQGLLDIQNEMALAAHKEQQDAWAATLKTWEDDARADKEIGGTKEKFDASLSDARAAIDAFGDKELRDLFNSTGVGNNKAFIRAFAKIGRLVKEDKLHPGGSAPSQQKDQAARMYPSMNPN